jgi:hypothetical protein
VGGPSLIVDGPQAGPDPVALAVAVDIRPGPRTVLAAHAGPCIRRGRALVALQAPVGALDLVPRGPASARGLVLAPLARAVLAVRVV